MFGVGPVDFGAGFAPMLLGAAGASLPMLWWLLSSIPPKPTKISFPGFRLMFEALAKHQKPLTMPKWQKALCLSAIMGVAIAGADPQINHNQYGANTTGPLVITVDNGWASAANWDARKRQIELLLNAAESQGRQVVIVPTATAAPGDDQTFSIMDVSEARSVLMELEPKPWPVNRDARITALRDLRSGMQQTPSVFWLSNGLAGDGTAFLQTLQDMGPVTIFQGDGVTQPHLLSLVDNADGKMIVKVQRPSGSGEETLTLTASNEAGRPLVQGEAVFADGETETQVTFNIPPELRKELARVSINGEDTAGATLLLDENWQIRSVGVIDTGSTEPLRDGANFVQQAVEPFTDLHRGSIEAIMKLPLSVIVATDEVSLLEGERTQLKEWVEKGGTLLRFAGPRLAANPNDNLVPVELRQGQKSTAGSLAGSGQGKIADFEASSPFHGLAIPDNVRVKQLVLPQPSADLDDHIWARMDDGTPLVTAKKQGDGWVILVHTTANMEWSNLPLSGELFLKMMRAVVSHSQGLVQQDQLNKSLPPMTTLDARGRLTTASRDVQALTSEVLSTGKMDAVHPPGYYGDETTRLAYNISNVVPNLEPLEDIPGGVVVTSYKQDDDNNNYATLLLVLAITALMADLAVRSRQDGKLSLRANSGRDGPEPGTG